MSDALLEKPRYIPGTPVYAAKEGELSVGQRVQTKWDDGEWWTGKIIKKGKDSVTVKWYDGSDPSEIPFKDIRKLPALADHKPIQLVAGNPVQAVYYSDGEFYDAVIVKVAGKRITVKFDDGGEKATVDDDDLIPNKKTKFVGESMPPPPAKHVPLADNPTEPEAAPAHQLDPDAEKRHNPKGLKVNDRVTFKWNGQVFKGKVGWKPSFGKVNIIFLNAEGREKSAQIPAEDVELDRSTLKAAPVETPKEVKKSALPAKPTAPEAAPAGKKNVIPVKPASVAKPAPAPAKPARTSMKPKKGDKLILKNKAGAPIKAEVMSEGNGYIKVKLTSGSKKGQIVTFQRGQIPYEFDE